MYISVLCSIFLIKLNMDCNQKTHLPGFYELIRRGELHCGPDHIDKMTQLQVIKTETTPLRLSNCTKAMHHQYIKRM